MREFNIEEVTISSFHQALRQGATTCNEVINAYLTRITHHDPTLKSLIHINPNAISTSQEKDKETKQYIQNDHPFPPLHGVPIILKDNYTTKDLPTTAGSKALNSLHTSKDSDVVSRLRDAGAIILAKANLHEFALHGTTTSSLGGQTLNPYDLSRTPGGSSGGTAVALAANFGLVGCGTDTMNSLRSPASACGIVGFRPSRGVVSCVGIVPVSETQDVAGPMGRTVEDVTVLYDVMRGGSAEPRSHGSQGRKVRIGVLDAYFKLEGDASSEELSENSIVQKIVRDALSSIQNDLDISLVPVESPPEWSLASLLANADTQPFEFQEYLDAFLQSSHVTSTPHSSLKSIVESGQYHKEAVTEVFFASLQNPDVFSTTSQEYHSRLDTIASFKESIQRCFQNYDIHALVYPHQRQLAVNVGVTRQPNRNGILAAVTGNPAICLPAGFTSSTSSAPLGVPVGLELMGRNGCDDELLYLARRVEGVLAARKVPVLT